MSTISASTTTTTAYKVTADTTGTLVFQTGASPTTALTISSAQVATFAQAPVLPSASIPQAALAANVAGNGPAFSAYSTAAQTIVGNVSTKIQLNVEEYDTNNNFDPTTNYRFTPNVAGYYQISAGIGGSGSGAGYFVSQLYKNGSKVKDGANFPVSATYGPQSSISALIYLNGSTDYVELYGQASNNNTLATGAQTVYMQGFLARAA